MKIVYFLIYVFIMSWISGWRDMVRFVYKGTWDRSTLAKWIPYWEASQSSKLDPFHFAGGLMWTLIFILITVNAIWVVLFGTQLITPIPFIPALAWYWLILIGIGVVILLWAYFYWMRNIIMHIAGRCKEDRRWKYLNPFWKFFERKK